MKTATRPEEQGSRAHGPESITVATAQTKIARVLAHLLTGASIIRFEAERLGDHCLPSTVAKLANDYSLVFQRQPEKVPNRWGKPCLVTRYSLPASERDKARKVLALVNRRGRAKP